MPNVLFNNVAFEADNVPLDVPGDTVLGAPPDGMLFCPLQVIVLACSPLAVDVGDATITVLAQRGVEEYILVPETGSLGALAGAPLFMMILSPYPGANSVALNNDFTYKVRIGGSTADGGAVHVIVTGFLKPGDDQV